MLIEITNSTLLALFFFHFFIVFGINKKANNPIPIDIGKNNSIYFRIILQEYFNSITLKMAPDNIVEKTIAKSKKI